MGIVILGAGLGLCLALVEQVLRRAWVQVQSGRQEGRIYLLAHPRCRLGLDERAEIGIFGDPAVARQHAEIESTPQGYVLRHLAGQGYTRVNGGTVAGGATFCTTAIGSSWDTPSRLPAALRSRTEVGPFCPSKRVRSGRRASKPAAGRWRSFADAMSAAPLRSTRGKAAREWLEWSGGAGPAGPGG